MCTKSLSLAALATTAALLACRPTPTASSPPAPPPARTDTLRPDWATAFAAEGATGTFVLFDPATGRTQRYNPERAATRLCPASTFKVYNSLVILGAGAVRDVDSLFRWDGRERQVPVWNQDHSLRTGMQHSVVWLYQRLANTVGRGAYEAAFAKTPYGNSSMGEPLDMAWLDGSLRISADEQIGILDGLRRGTLGFADTLQATVRDIMPVVAEGKDASGPYRIKAKTGMGVPTGEAQIGWIVGWVERPGGDLVFALNAEQAPGQIFEMAGGRLRLLRELLKVEA